MEPISETPLTTATENHLTPTAQQIAEKRYFRKDENGNCIEDWAGLTKRVVEHVCKNESQEFKDKVYDLIYHTKFLPNTPCLVNAGKNIRNAGISACYVTEAPDDSWESIVKNIKNFGDVARAAGGCGVSFSKIRPEGDPVCGSSHAKACGPIESMRIVSEAMSSITQGGIRGMACMSTLHVSHPDVMKFIVCKQRERALKTFLKEDISNQFAKIHNRTHDQLNIVLDKFISNFNISVMVSDEFMESVEKDKDWQLEFNGQVYQTLKATQIFDAITENAWKNGDPGILFEDTINDGPYKYSQQKIDATNPCSEQVLPHWGVCNLGSIDVSKFFNTNCDDCFDWNYFKTAIHLSIQFLDDVVSANVYPNKKFQQWAEKNRPVGLGIMGLADLFLKQKMIYGSVESLTFAEKIASFLESESQRASVKLAKERGMPESCKYPELGFRRNVTLTSIAPTGSISLLASCNGSIEPFYSPTIYIQNNTGQYTIEHPYSDKPYFRCAVDPDNKCKEVTWQQHVDMQIVFQKFGSSGVSKTINMPSTATIEDVAGAYIRAWKGKCKGITVYRDGSKSVQVLNTKSKGTIGSNVPSSRPKEVPCDIFKARADGFDWHVIVGKVDDNPYELFAVNGRVDLPEVGAVIKKKKKHYSLVDTDGNVLIDNLIEEEQRLHPKISLETRRFSLELRHGIHPQYIVDQIDKSHEVITSFSKACGRIMKSKYIDSSVVLADNVCCPLCAKNNKQVSIINESGCWRCSENCGYSKCG